MQAVCWGLARLDALQGDPVGSGPSRHRRGLSGAWHDRRGGQVRPDLVLIDQTPDAETLRLGRLGSQSERGL